MRKILTLSFALVMCLLVSCNKGDSTSSSSTPFIVGTTWTDADGNKVTFTKTHVTYNGTSSATYKIAEILSANDDEIDYFSIEDLKAGTKTYIYGEAILSQRRMILSAAEISESSEIFALVK